ncbi:MAG: PAS domain S-box protein [Verrucomicrobia bacterium]|nr:PAS domain S-box protein [Verrucomicrobiota bacterium]
MPKENKNDAISNTEDAPLPSSVRPPSLPVSVGEAYRNLLETIPSTTLLVHEEKILHINCAGLKLYGFSASHQASGANFLDLFVSNERTALLEKIQSLTLKSPALHGVAVTNLRPDGTILHGALSASMVTIDEKEMLQVVILDQNNVVLQRLGRSLSSANTEQEAARVIMEAATELFSWDACTIDLYQPERDALVPVLVVDTIKDSKTVIINDPGPRPSPMARRVLQNGAELLLRTPEQLASTDGLRFGNASRLSASLMNVPIRHGERTIGIFSIQSYEPDAYDRQDLRVLESLADYCGGALERIRAESDLRNSENRFYSLWENSVDGMRLTDANGTILAVNEAYCNLVGMRREELEGEPFTVTYSQTEKLDEFLKKYQLRFKKRIVQKQATRRMKFRTGGIVDLEDTNSFIDSQDGKPLLLSLFRDITAQKRLEEELRQSQKMESIGQLAGGIAHDFNNILTVINGHASLLLMDETHSSDTRESIEQIGRSAERAANLTRQLLAFSRKQMMQARKLDLNEVVGDMTKILQRVLGEDICLRVSFGSTSPIVYADPGMMEQILLNLAVNSRDSMPNGGSLSVATLTTSVDHSHPAKPAELPPGPFACLRVHDTGCGIPEDLLTKIFEPFFTTKDVGKGTGLGLATVYGIVKQHRGFLQVSSEVNRGTTFEIYLPNADGSADKSKVADDGRMRGGMETILLVEDEDGVRTLAASLLKRLGYRVIEANSGVSALELWQVQSQSIDLVLTDIVMPDGLSGRELADRLKADKPEMEVIFTSGYPRDEVADQGFFREGFNFLQKPYQPHALAQLVRQCLDNQTL